MTPDRCLIFPSVDYVRNIIIKHSLKQNLPVVIDCSHIYGADFTAAKVFISSLSFFFHLYLLYYVFIIIENVSFSGHRIVNHRLFAERPVVIFLQPETKFGHCFRGSSSKRLQHTTILREPRYRSTVEQTHDSKQHSCRWLRIIWITSI